MRHVYYSVIFARLFLINCTLKQATGLRGGSWVMDWSTNILHLSEIRWVEDLAVNGTLTFLQAYSFVHGELAITLNDSGGDVSNSTALGKLNISWSLYGIQGVANIFGEINVRLCYYFYYTAPLLTYIYIYIHIYILFLFVMIYIYITYLCKLLITFYDPIYVIYSTFALYINYQGVIINASIPAP